MDYETAFSMFRLIEETGELVRKSGTAIRRKVGSINKDGYLYTKIRGKCFFVHRIVWLLHTGAHPVNEIDHIDGNKLNNRPSNLRDVSRSLNNQNIKSPRAHNKSTGVLGVEFSKHMGKYRARIVLGGKYIHLGYHETAESAHAAYVAAKRELHPGCTI